MAAGSDSGKVEELQKMEGQEKEVRDGIAGGGGESPADQPTGNTTPPAAPSGDRSMVFKDTLNEISLTVAVEVGRTVMTVKEIPRQFRSGNVLRLDKRTGEPLDVYVNGLLFARAEVVFEGEQIGARIIEVVESDGASQHRSLTHPAR